MYGPYWILMRAHNSGHVDFLWQTEAWSGGNIDSDIAVMQRNALGYKTIGGVQCDIDEQHITDSGQFIPNTAPAPTPTPTPTPTPVPGDGNTTLDTVFPSESRYATPGVAFPLASYILFIDGRLSEWDVERKATEGDPASLALVQQAATNGDTIAQLVLNQIKTEYTK
jgi:hypothetical protein